jgi:glycine/D-amino acid oxidase-like deaminating enzyme
MHTVIAGNGILGLTTAFRLARRARPGDVITIVGQPSRPGSATLAAAAMLNSFAEVEADGLQTDLERYRFELSHLATSMWPEFIDDMMRVAGTLGPPACASCQGRCRGCFDKGTYVVNNTAADSLDDDNFDAILAALVEFGEPHELVSPRDVPNYMPEQRHRATRAVYLPNEGWMNPRLTIGTLEAAMATFPFVRFEDGVVDRLVASGDRIEAVILDGGRRVEGDVYLLATGASAWEVLTRSKLGIPMQRVFYGVGVSVEIKSREFPHSKCIRTPNRGLACGVYSAPYLLGPGQPHDHILVGASNFISTTPQWHGRLTSVESLLRAAIEQLNANFYRADLIRVNVGWRPTSQDTHMLVGKTSLANLVVATGTKRDGFHLSPLLSEYISAMLCGESIDPRFSVFGPERPLIHELTREQAIEKAVRHQMSAAYQHGFTPAKSRMPEQLMQMHRTDLEQLHDRVGATTWGIPVEMLDMYRYGHATVSSDQ